MPNYGSCWLCWHDVHLVVDCTDIVSAWSMTRWTLFFREYLSKTKMFGKPFLPVRMGPRSNLLSEEKKVKNLVSLSLEDLWQAFKVFQKYPHSLVCVGIVISQHSKQNRIGIVNDYDNTVSAYLLTLLKLFKSLRHHTTAPFFLLKCSRHLISANLAPF